MGQTTRSGPFLPGDENILASSIGQRLLDRAPRGSEVHLSNQCLNASLIKQTSSLFLKINSLFGSNISLFHLVGNWAKKRHYFSMLRAWLGLLDGEIRQNSLFIPCITGKSAETDSLRTAHTTTQSPPNPGPRFDAAIVPCFPRVRP